MKRERVGTALPLILSLIVALASGCALTGSSSGQIELSAIEFDFGTIGNAEPVSQVFQVRNVGAEELQITGVSSSCGCTTAEIGSRHLSPREATDLKVTYDPQAHDGATGQFMRLVCVRSSDPDNPEVSLTIRVTVVE